MARVRKTSRKAARSRLNLELVGIAALALAAFLTLALAAPDHAGAVGGALAHALGRAFGRAAWAVPILVALFGGIVFLEVAVARTLLTVGVTAFCYAAIADAALDRGGGFAGRMLHGGLTALVGGIGASIVLALCAVALTVYIADFSVKRAIGAAVVRTTKARAAVGGALRATSERARERGAAGAEKKAQPALQRPKTWREAFHLPEAVGPTPKPKAAPAVTEPVVSTSATGERIVTTSEIPGEPAHAAAEASGPSAAQPVPRAVPIALPPIAPMPARAFVRGEPFVATYEGEDEDGDPRVTVGDYEPASVTGADVRRKYALPNLDLFDPPQAQIFDESLRSQLLEDTLASFGVGAKVTHVQRGPSITRYELKPEKGVKISRITALADDLALALAATSVRIEAPIPGKSAIGIEVPNAQTSIVSIREILDALPSRGTVPPLHMALGKDITGRPVFGDLGKMPHLLVAGATGSGKSVCLNTIIASLLVSATPDQVQMLFIDPKRVELTVYNGIPHLIKDVITDAKLAAGALFEMTKEMDARYERFAKASVRKIEEYNAKFPEETLPYVVIVIDELADLMLIAPAKVETTICRLAQLARATGIHLVVATQRPSVDVITGIIKANIPSRIAFAVSSQVDSRTILDMVGAERLLGRGDMLFLPIDAPKPVRSQGAYITNDEVGRLVEFWSTQARPENLLDVEVVPIEEDDKKRDVDPLCYEAAQFIIQSQFASTAQLQQRFSIGHPRAVRVMKQLEEFGVVGPHEGTKARQINVGLAELETIADRLGRTDQTDLFDDVAVR